MIASVDGNGCGCDFFSCTGVWHLLVCRVSSSRCCSGKSHGKAAIMRRQPARASFLRVSASSPLSVRLNLTSLALCHLASSSTAQENGRLARRLLQLNSGVEASGAGAESEGDARAVDFPSCPRCVAVRVVVSDACKASHIQRSPLSMGRPLELGEWRALVLRKISPSSI